MSSPPTPWAQRATKHNIGVILQQQRATVMRIPKPATATRIPKPASTSKQPSNLLPTTSTQKQHQTQTEDDCDSSKDTAIELSAGEVCKRESTFVLHHANNKIKSLGTCALLLCQTSGCRPSHIRGLKTGHNNSTLLFCC